MNIIQIPVPQRPWQASGIKGDFALHLCRSITYNCILKGYKFFLERGTKVPRILLKDKHSNEGHDYNEVDMV